MILYVTDDQERDAEVLRALHRTRTLHAVLEVGEHNLHHAVREATAFTGQLVMDSTATRPLQVFGLVVRLLGIGIMRSATYLQLCAWAHAGPQAPPIAPVRATPVASGRCGPPI